MENNSKPTVSLYLTVVIGSLFIVSQVCSWNVSDNRGQIEKILSKSTAQEEAFEDSNKATLYSIFGSDEYNQVVAFVEKGVKVYAFRKETDTEVGNGGFKFNYELGRIQINPNDPLKSRCTFNYRAKMDNNDVKWLDCSEKQFIKSLNKIAKLKEKEYLPLKEMYEEERIADICGMYDSENDVRCEKYKNMSDKDYEKFWNNFNREKQKQLAKLRNTALEKMN